MASVAVEDKAHKKVKEKCEDSVYSIKDVTTKVLIAWAEDEIEVDIVDV